ncbi:FecR domain-containing protein [Ancylomarina sp. DW003]|nr:FecR domain-containing protein [Ancylomarina sp. DW003]MDE5420731.1 FecR domain-containing protein [Ancylomarina sp. DW003]
MENIDWSIIHKKLKGRISSKEEQIFQKWLSSSQNHRDYFTKCEMFYKRDVEDLDQVLNTTDEFMKKLDSKSRIIRLRKILSYAAVITLPILLAAGMLFLSDSGIKDQMAQMNTLQTAEAIQNQALLITSSGKTYDLESGIEQAIDEEQGVKIRKYLKAGLKYENRSSAPKKELIYNTLKTAKGGEYQLELADGTKVYLNCDSELRYPVNFGERERRVELKGEAFFEVTKNGQPFVVDVNNLSVEVLGTKFNVMAYANEESIQTTLVSGKVKVAVKGDDDENVESIYLEPGKQASWNKLNQTLSCKEVETDLYTSWINGYFRFENQRLEDVMRTISRWYDVKVFYQNPDLKNKRLTGKLYRFEDFSVLANMIEKISEAELNENNNAVVIRMK